MRIIKRVAFMASVLLIVIIISMLMHNEFTYDKKEEKLVDLVYEYQLPNGMFFDRHDIEMEVDAYSTILMKKIKNIAYQDEIEINVQELDFTYDNIDEIYFLQDCHIHLSDEMCQKYEKYIDSILQSDGLVSFSNDENIETRMIFTLYAVKFAEQFDIKIEKQESITQFVEIKLGEVSKEKSIFHVSTLLQLADKLRLNYEREFYESFYNEKINYFEEKDAITDSDIMDLYYLSIIKNIIEVEKGISDNLLCSIVEAMNYSYTNLSIFYDCVYILETYSELEANIETIICCIEKLDKYELGEGKYACISIINPSILATYCGVEMLYEMGKLENKVGNIISYLLYYCEDDNIKLMSCEDIYCCYQALIKLDSTLLNDNTLKQNVIDSLISNLISNESISIRELYCARELNKKFLENQEIDRLVNEKLEELVLTVNIHEISAANYCMLLIAMQDQSGDDENIWSNAEEIDLELVTIMDAFYYVEYCNVYGLEVNESAVVELLKSVKNDNGYYISKYQKENSMFTLYLGYLLSN